MIDKMKNTVKDMEQNADRPVSTRDCLSSSQLPKTPEEDGKMPVSSKENGLECLISEIGGQTASRCKSAVDDCDSRGEAGGGHPHVNVASNLKSATPVDHRHGFFPWLCLIPEVDEPYNYERKVKWIITSVVAVAAATAPMGASIFYREKETPTLYKLHQTTQLIDLN
jgi:hypothetical protein